MTIVEPQQKGFREHGLLGEAASELRLRVSWDAGLTGEVIHVGSQKATVGTAAGNTICLAGAGIAPLECLLLRGASHDVVRWFDADAAEAGEEIFQDEIIAAGDSLLVGSAELEMLSDTPSSDSEASPATSSDATEYLLRLETLERQLAELQRAATATPQVTPHSTKEDESQTELIGKLTEQLEAMRAVREDERSHWDAERIEFEKQLRLRSEDTVERQEELEALRRELVLVREEQANLASAREQQAQQLVEVREELETRRQADAERESAAQGERQEMARLLEEDKEQCATLQVELATERQRTQELQEQVADLECQITEAAEAAQDESGERESWDAERQTLLAQVDEANERLASLEREWEQRAVGGAEPSDELQQRIEQLQLQYDSERDQWQSDRRWFEEELEAKRRQLEAEHRATAERAAVAMEEEQPEELAEEASSDNDVFNDEADGPAQDPHFTAAAQTHSPLDRFLSASSLLDDDESEPFSADDHSSRLASSAYINDMSDDVGEANLLSESLHEDAIYSEHDVVIDEEETTVEQPSDEPPVSTADVLARLGQTGVWNEADAEEHESSMFGHDESSASFTGNDAFQSDTSADAPATAPVWPRNTPASTDALHGGNEATDQDGEESIEDYMTRLMQRVHGGDDEADPPRVEGPVEASPITEYTETPFDPTPEPIESEVALPAAEYKPSRRAPEANVSLNAMRELANSSHRTAIASHAKRNWSSVMKLKLAMSLFAAVAVLASIIFFWGNPIPMACGALVGLGVLGYWGWLANNYRKLLIDSLMLDTSSADGGSPSEALGLAPGSSIE